MCERTPEANMELIIFAKYAISSKGFLNSNLTSNKGEELLNLTGGNFANLHLLSGKSL